MSLHLLIAQRRQDCQAQILNFNGAKYKKFLNAADAELWISQHAVSLPVADSTFTPAQTPSATSPCSSSPIGTSSAAKDSELKSASTIASATSIVSSSDIPLSTISSAPASTTISTGRQSTNTSMRTNPDPVIIYTDGSSKGNGQPGSVAGVGVWYGENDSRCVVPSIIYDSTSQSINATYGSNLAERCPGIQTNNCAELTASSYSMSGPHSCS